MQEQRAKDISGDGHAPGARPKLSRWRWRNVAIGVVSVLVLLVLVGIFVPTPPNTGAAPIAAISPAETPTSRRPKTVEIAAADLDEQFRDNEITAEKTYGAAPIIVTGTVAKISSVAGVWPQKASADVQLEGADPFSVVSAFVADESAAASLHPSQNVTFRCIAVRKSLGDVVLDDCHEDITASGV